jgi:DNA-binding transcriptional LysR family regulator
MIALPIGPPLRMAAVGAPSYFARHPPPRRPQDLAAHTCINLRLPTYGGLYAWEFERNRRAVNVRVDGQLVFNSIGPIRAAAVDGFGIAYLPEGEVLPEVHAGRLVRVLEDWCPPFPGYHLYYPSRRQASPAFALVVEALRYRGTG